MYIKIHTNDARNDCPKDLDKGVYYVQKKRTLKRFSFGKDISEFKNVNDAFVAMSEFLAARKDADDLTVQLLTNHW